MHPRRRGLLSRLWRFGAAVVVAYVAVCVAVIAVQSSGAEDPRSAQPGPSGVVSGVVSIVGDSYTAGSPENTEGRVWPRLLEAEFPAITVDSHAVGATGYTVGGANTFAAQAALVRADADLVVMFGSRNDLPAAPAATRSDAVAAIRIAQEHAPNARIVVVSFPWVNDEPTKKVMAMGVALRQAATETGAVFVDALGERWLVGKGMIGRDGIHPTNAGQDAIAEHMAAALRADPTAK